MVDITYNLDWQPRPHTRACVTLQWKSNASEAIRR